MQNAQKNALFREKCAKMCKIREGKKRTQKQQKLPPKHAKKGSNLYKHEENVHFQGKIELSEINTKLTKMGKKAKNW